MVASMLKAFSQPIQWRPLVCQYGGTSPSWAVLPVWWYHKRLGLSQLNLYCFGNEKNLCCFGNARLKSLFTSVICTEFFCEWAAIAIAPLLIPGLLGKLARERKLTCHTSKYMLVPRGHLRGRAKIEV